MAILRHVSYLGWMLVALAAQCVASLVSVLSRWLTVSSLALWLLVFGAAMRRLQAAAWRQCPPHSPRPSGMGETAPSRSC